MVWLVAYVGLCHIPIYTIWSEMLMNEFTPVQYWFKNVSYGEIRKWLVIYGLGQCNGTALSASTLDQYIYTTKEKCFVR